MHNSLVKAENFTQSQPCSSASIDATNCHSPTIRSAPELYWVFHLKFKLTSTHKPLPVKKNETDGNIEFLQLYPIVAANALLKISMAIISCFVTR